MADKIDIEVLEQELESSDSENSNEVIEEADQQSEAENNSIEKKEKEEDDPEVDVSIGEDSPPSDDLSVAPDWVKRLRKSYREQEKKIKEYEEKLQSLQVSEKKPDTLEAKPTLESCDYDAEKFESAVDEWYAKKRIIEAQKEQERQEENKKSEAWNNRIKEYVQMKSTLRVRDYEEAEDNVKNLFSVSQQGIMLHGCENPAVVVYALGKHSKKAEELASISDPVKFAFSIAKLESELKVIPKNKAAVKPEKVVSGTGKVSGSIDSTLERLREEASKTGDYTKVHLYKQQKRNS